MPSYRVPLTFTHFLNFQWHKEARQWRVALIEKTKKEVPGLVEKEHAAVVLPEGSWPDMALSRDEQVGRLVKACKQYGQGKDAGSVLALGYRQMLWKLQQVKKTAYKLSLNLFLSIEIIASPLEHSTFIVHWSGHPVLVADDVPRRKLEEKKLPALLSEWRRASGQRQKDLQVNVLRTLIEVLNSSAQTDTQYRLADFLTRQWKQQSAFSKQDTLLLAIPVKKGLLVQFCVQPKSKIFYLKFVASTRGASSEMSAWEWRKKLNPSESVAEGLSGEGARRAEAALSQPLGKLPLVSISDYQREASVVSPSSAVAHFKALLAAMGEVIERGDPLPFLKSCRVFGGGQINVLENLISTLDAQTILDPTVAQVPASEINLSFTNKEGGTLRLGGPGPEGFYGLRVKEIKGQKEQSVWLLPKEALRVEPILKKGELGALPKLLRVCWDSRSLHNIPNEDAFLDRLSAFCRVPLKNERPLSRWAAWRQMEDAKPALGGEHKNQTGEKEDQVSSLQRGVPIALAIGHSQAKDRAAGSKSSSRGEGPSGKRQRVEPVEDDAAP